MIRIILLSFLISGVACAGPKKKPNWSEYEASFHVYEGQQPVVTIRWWSMDSSGPYQEYPEIWRKGMKFGHGKRFQVEKLTGVDYDGLKKKGQVVTAVVVDTKTKKKLTFSSDRNAFYKSYTKEWMQKRLLKYPPKKNDAEQGGADQPATAAESKTEGNSKPQPKSEGRSQ